MSSLLGLLHHLVQQLFQGNIRKHKGVSGRKGETNSSSISSLNMNYRFFPKMPKPLATLTARRQGSRADAALRFSGFNSKECP